MSNGLRPMEPIPVSAAKMIADSYGYDQVVVIARRVGDHPEPHGEHCTTYGRSAPHCAVAARMGDVLKHRVMGWPDAISDADLKRLGGVIFDVLGWAVIDSAFVDMHQPEIRQLAARLGIVSVPARGA